MVVTYLDMIFACWGEDILPVVVRQTEDVGHHLAAPGLALLVRHVLLRPETAANTLTRLRKKYAEYILG